MHTFLKISLSVTALLGFAACGGSGGDSTSTDTISSTSTTIVQTGIFADSLVEGLRYKTATQSGYTNAKGEFNFYSGEDIEFFVGDYSIGKYQASLLMSPYSLYPHNSNTAIKIAQLLQTLDSIGTPEDGAITIADFKNFTILDTAPPPEDLNFQSEVETLLSKPLVSETVAREHLNNTLRPAQTGNPQLLATGANAFNAFDPSTFSNSLCTPLALENASGIFVSVNGQSTASGTQSDPLDLATALSINSPVQAGGTIWINEGTYTGNFVSELRGTQSNPIKVKPLPGKRVILDGNVANSTSLQIKGSWTNYYGLEIISSSLAHTSQEDSSSPSDISTNGGVTINGADTKLINFISHDNVGSGVNSWSDAPNSEMYGNIIYNNGWTAPGRGHGHAIYAQNSTGFKKITNNIIFFGYGTGIHVYTQGGQIEGFDVQDNTWFMTGSSDPRTSQRKDNCLIGGFQPVKNLTLKNNQGYSHNSRGTRLGYGGDVTGQSALISNNYLSENLWITGSWSSMSLSNTSVFRGLTGSASDYITNGTNGNTVLSSPPTSGKKVFVKANAYDPRRAKIVIYNYDEDANVSVDLSSVLKAGEAYRIHSVFGLFNNPLLTGIYDGNPVSIPMDEIDAPQPTGTNNIDDIEDNPHRKFGTFILTHAGCV